MIEEQKIVKHTLSINDLQDICQLSRASLSANGKLLVYVITKVVPEENEYKDFITIVEVSTKKEINIWEGSAPQWSPLANDVAYLADYNGVNYIWVFSLDKASKRPLAPVYESHYFMGHLALKNIAWSPNAQHIAFISTNKPSNADAIDDKVKVIDRLLYKTKGGRVRPLITDNELSHVWVVNVYSGEARLITNGKYNEHSLCWSPDSLQIAFVSNRSANPDNNQLHDLWSIDVLSGNVTRYTQNFGTVYQPAWSPDGKNIAFSATQNKVSTNDSPAEDTQLYIITIADKKVRCLTQAQGFLFDKRVEQISWHPQADEVYFLSGSEGTTAIYKVAINGGNPVHVEGKDCHILEYAINPAGNIICFTSTDTTHLNEIFLHNLSTNVSNRITNNSGKLLHYCQMQEANTFWFKSFDDTDVQGWLMKPGKFEAGQKYPMVLVIHGGPHNMFGYEFEDRMQLMSAKGYGVLFINPRGSSGYGQAFSNGCVLNWGGSDYKDLMAGVDAVIKMNVWIDTNRLGVTGQSYGGFMTNWIITQTNRFKAAVVDGGISNLVSFAGTSLYHSLIEAEFNGSAYDNFSLLWQWSPLRNVKNVITPTLILHGEADNEVPLSQAEEMYIALKKIGVKCTMVQYTGEGHGWRPDLKPLNRYNVLKRTIDWFDKYLVQPHF